MKLLTINVCPPDRCNYERLPGIDARANRIIKLIKDEEPDIIFFVEQWYPVFGAVKQLLEQPLNNYNTKHRLKG